MRTCARESPARRSPAASRATRGAPRWLTPGICRPAGRRTRTPTPTLRTTFTRRLASRDGKSRRRRAPTSRLRQRERRRRRSRYWPLCIALTQHAQRARPGVHSPRTHMPSFARGLPTALAPEIACVMSPPSRESAGSRSSGRHTRGKCRNGSAGWRRGRLGPDCPGGVGSARGCEADYSAPGHKIRRSSCDARAQFGCAHGAHVGEWGLH